MNMCRWLAIGALLLLPQFAGADGAYFPRQSAWQTERERSLINEPSQKAVMLFQDGREQLIISPSFSGPPGGFAWVVPVPSRPQVKVLHGALFHELARIVEPAPPIHEDASGGAGTARSAPAPPPVVVLERKTVGAYDVSVLAATDGQALAKWLDSNGYYLPAVAQGPLAVYVRKEWTFVACRIKQAANAHGLQQGTLAPLSLTFATPQIVYPMRLSAANPAPFDLLLYILMPVNAPHSTASDWPAGPPPHLSFRAIGPFDDEYPTLQGLSPRPLALAWFKTRVAPEQCTRDYVWNAPLRQR